MGSLDRQHRCRSGGGDPGEIVFVAATIAGAFVRRILCSELIVGLECGTPLDEAREALLAAVEGVEGVMSDPGPEALVTESDDSSIAFLVRLWHKTMMHAKPVSVPVHRQRSP